jgi:GT2 family glycosyltransferase
MMDDNKIKEKIKFSLIILTYNKDEILNICLKRLYNICNSYDTEIILVDNNDDKTNRSSFIKEFKNKIYIKNNENTGVALGKNIGIQRSIGDYLIFLDDDSYMTSFDFREKIESCFDLNINLSAITFKILEKRSSSQWRNYPNLFPHTNKNLHRDKQLKTSYYLNTAHAIRRTSLKKTGLYLPEFFYGCETLEMSYRMIEKGYEILYEPSIIVNHYKDTDNLESSKEYLENIILSKLKISYIHFPDRLNKSYNLSVFLDLLKQTKNLSYVSKIKNSLKEWIEKNKERRDPISNFGLDEIKKTGVEILKI